VGLVDTSGCTLQAPPTVRSPSQQEQTMSKHAEIINDAISIANSKMGTKHKAFGLCWSLEEDKIILRARKCFPPWSPLEYTDNGYLFHYEVIDRNDGFLLFKIFHNGKMAKQGVGIKVREGQGDAWLARAIASFIKVGSLEKAFDPSV
jgi:hypothetical protein